MPDAYSPLVTWGPLTLHGLAAAEPIAPLLLSGPRPSLLPLRIEGADDQGRPALVDAPAEVLAGDVPGAWRFDASARAGRGPRRCGRRFVPGSEADVALRRRLRQIEEARL